MEPGITASSTWIVPLRSIRTAPIRLDIVRNLFINSQRFNSPGEGRFVYVDQLLFGSISCSRMCRSELNEGIWMFVCFTLWVLFNDDVF